MRLNERLKALEAATKPMGISLITRRIVYPGDPHRECTTAQAGRDLAGPILHRQADEPEAAFIERAKAGARGLVEPGTCARLALS